MTGAEKTYTLAEVAKHKSEESCWLVIDEKVYDVTPFLEDHPGGNEIVIQNSGGEATDAFEDIGHSGEARGMLKKYQIGVCFEKDQEMEKMKKAQKEYRSGGNSNFASTLIPIFVAILAALLFYYFSNN